MLQCHSLHHIKVNFSNELKRELQKQTETGHESKIKVRNQVSGCVTNQVWEHDGTLNHNWWQCMTWVRRKSQNGQLSAK